MYEERSIQSASSFASVNVQDDYEWETKPHHSFQEVASAGPPLAPLDFPIPSIAPMQHLTRVIVVHPTTQKRLLARHVLYPQKNKNHCADDQSTTADSDSSTRSLEEVLRGKHAYLTKKKLSQTASGQVRICLLLQPRRKAGRTSKTEWELTSHWVVVKSFHSGAMGRSQSVLRNDPLCDVAARQHLGNYHPHIVGCLDAFQDGEFLYEVLPYMSGGTLYKRLLGESMSSASFDTEASSLSSGETIAGSSCASSAPTTSTITTNTSAAWTLHPVSEDQARRWFSQLLNAMDHLQKKGVCHGGISLESILIDHRGNMSLSSFGLALRVPYQARSNLGGTGVTDVSEGSLRCLLRCCMPDSYLTDIDPIFLAPELTRILMSKSQQASSPGRVAGEEWCHFDGLSVDLWSLGIVLFIMLTGTAPFRIAHESDKRFLYLCKKGLVHKIKSIRELSPQAADLLQNMLWANPNKRLSLAEIMRHPWSNPPNQNRGLSSSSGKNGTEVLQPKERVHHLSYFNQSFDEEDASEGRSEDGGPERLQALHADQRFVSI